MPAALYIANTKKHTHTAAVCVAVHLVSITRTHTVLSRFYIRSDTSL